MTNDVPNQSPSFEEVNLFSTDTVLQEAVAREGADHAIEELAAVGAACGSAEALERGRLANEFPPRLKTHDPKGRRLDIVEFHPAYHACMAQSMAAGLHCASWEKDQAGAALPGANVARAGAFYMPAQMEAGHCCPLTMTNAAVPTLRLQPDLAENWVPRILSRSYDPAFRPAGEKASLTIGMGMTE